MAHTKAGGSTRLGRDSHSKRLGVKLFAGQIARPGSILVRQRGTFYLPGKNVRRGGDDTLYAVLAGIITFRKRTRVRYDGSRVKRSYIDVMPVVKA